MLMGTSFDTRRSTLTPRSDVRKHHCIGCHFLLIGEGSSRALKTKVLVLASFSCFLLPFLFCIVGLVGKGVFLSVSSFSPFFFFTLKMNLRFFIYIFIFLMGSII